MNLSLLLALVALAGPAHADADAAFAQGLGALRDGQPAAAAEAFSQAQAEGARSADVYHGLGNAWYREGKRGHAIAAWRRGQRLDPGNGDLQTNLELARQANEDLLEEPKWRRGPFVWLGWLAPGRVLLAGAALVGLALSLGAVGTLRRRRGKSRPLPRLAVLLGLLGVVLGLSPLLSPQPDTVVVVAPSLSASSTISDDGVVLFELHEGAEVERLETDREHVLVALPDGRKGWLPAEGVLSTDPSEAL